MKLQLNSDKQNHYKPAAEAEGDVTENASSQETAQLKAFQKMADESEQVQQGKQFAQLANSNSQQPIQQKEKNQEENSKEKSEGTSSSSLPTQLKSGIEGLSGYSMDDVNVHYNSNQPAQLKAHAFTQGSDIHVAPGQEKHLAHEAWHVVQQKQGRVQPTTQLKGKNLNDDSSLEKEADVMGKKAESAESGEKTVQQKSLTTKDVSQAKSKTVQRKKKKQKPAPGGQWSTTSFRPVEDGAEIYIEFAPNEGVDAKKIGLIQMAKKVEKGKNYDESARETYEHNKAIDEGSKEGEKKFQMGAAKRKAQRSDGESHIDRSINKNNPIYGAPDLKAGEDVSKTKGGGKLRTSEKDRLDGNYQSYELGYNYYSWFGLKRNQKSAKLYDMPNLPGALSELKRDPEKKSEMVFETTAVCIDGPQKGMYYGSVEWGFKIENPDKGVELLPFKVISDKNPSGKMRDVMENWNDGEFQDDFQNPQIPLPDQE